MNKSLSEFFYKQLYHEFKTFDQFEQMTQILIEISKNKEVNNNYMEINFGIIYIAEKGFYIETILTNEVEAIVRFDKEKITNQICSYDKVEDT